LPESNSISSQSPQICWSLSFPPGRIYHTVLPSPPWSSSTSSFLLSGLHSLIWFSIILNYYHMAIALYTSSFYIVCKEFIQRISRQSDKLFRCWN
jgi:hypothetical protein